MDGREGGTRARPHVAANSRGPGHRRGFRQSPRLLLQAQARARAHTPADAGQTPEAGQGQAEARQAAQAPRGQRGREPPDLPALPYRLIRLHLRSTCPNRPASPALWQPRAIVVTRGSDNNTVFISNQQRQQEQQRQRQQRVQRILRRLGLGLLDTIGVRIMRVHRRRGGGVWFSNNDGQGQRTLALVVSGALQ